MMVVVYFSGNSDVILMLWEEARASIIIYITLLTGHPTKLNLQIQV